jgi:hypothetical protein
MQVYSFVWFLQNIRDQKLKKFYKTKMLFNKGRDCGPQVLPTEERMEAEVKIRQQQEAVSSSRKKLLS